MNIRSLTRGDGAVIGAALLLLIASFLPFFSIDGDCESGGGVECDASAWGTATMPMLGAVHLAAVIAAVLIVVGRSLPADRKLGGLSFDQWGVALSVFVAWSSVFSMFASAWDVFGALENIADTQGGGDYELGIGAYLTLLFGLALGVFAILGAQLPALKAPLLSGPRPQQPGMGMPGVQQPGGYGYPGAQPQQPQQPGGYGYPGPAGGAPAGFGGGAPAPAPQPAPPAAGGGDFTPFWFAVPVSRPLFGEDGSPTPIAELTPGTWYLAVEQRGPALVAQTQDGRRGVLQDTSGIQRG